MDAIDVTLKSKIAILEHIVRGNEIKETLDLICRETETIDPLARCCVMTLD